MFTATSLLQRCVRKFQYNDDLKIRYSHISSCEHCEWDEDDDLRPRDRTARSRRAEITVQTAFRELAHWRLERLVGHFWHHRAEEEDLLDGWGGGAYE